MTMTLSGSGTIAGLVAGGLPDATVTSPDLASNAVDSQTLSLFNATGSAPVYACRAWVNFNGTGTVAIRASGNVSSITDNRTGDYTVNFTTAMPDANYAFATATNSWASDDPGGNSNIKLQTNGSSSSTGSPVLLSTTQAKFISGGASNQLYDPVFCQIVFFR